jgi:hypothetical protein
LFVASFAIIEKALDNWQDGNGNYNFQIDRRSPSNWVYDIVTERNEDIFTSQKLFVRNEIEPFQP